jgi:hypothetical protein
VRCHLNIWCSWKFFATLPEKLGPDHLDTLRVLHELGLLYKEELDEGRAIELFEQILAAYRQKVFQFYPGRTRAAWELWLLYTSEKHPLANDLLQKELIWLLDADSSGLALNQRHIQAQVREVASK